MSVSRFNSEGYHDPVVYEALTNMEKEQRAAVKAVPAYRPLVYICSPYAGDMETNAENARKYSRFAVDNMAIPFAPHLLMPQYMDEAMERDLALRMGFIFLSKCEQAWGKDSLFYNRLQIAYGNSLMEKKWKNRDVS